MFWCVGLLIILKCVIVIDVVVGSTVITNPQTVIVTLELAT